MSCTLLCSSPGLYLCHTQGHGITIGCGKVDPQVQYSMPCHDIYVIGVYQVLVVYMQLATKTCQQRGSLVALGPGWVIKGILITSYW